MSQFRVFQDVSLYDDEKTVERAIFSEHRQMWCAVEDRPATTVADTEGFWCHSLGHDIGPEGCYYRTVLVIGESEPHKSECPQCGHAIGRHPDRVCRVALNELPSCLDCREALESLRWPSG